MSYNPNFSRPAQGNFSADKSFSQVRIGTDAYLLEDELNEMQAILREQNRDTVRQLLSSGVLRDLVIVNDPARPNVVKIAPFEAVIDGVKVKVAGVNTTQTARTSTDGEDNLIRIGNKPTSGYPSDLVYLEVYEEEVREGEVLFKHGAQSSDFTIGNDLIDPRIGQETGRRMQVKSVLRVLSPLPVHATYYDLLGNRFQNVEHGVYKSSAGRTMLELFRVIRSADETELGTPSRLYPLARMKASDLVAEGTVSLKHFDRDTMTVLQGLNADDSIRSGKVIPILRYFTWWRHAYQLPQAGACKTPAEWGALLFSEPNEAWRRMKPIEFMSADGSGWHDNDIQLMTTIGDCFADNVSVLCMQNVTSATKTFSPYAYVSSQGATNPQALAGVAYSVVNPGIYPSAEEMGAFTNHWLYPYNGTYTTDVSPSFAVPAGLVVIFILKTTPTLASTANGLNFYHNYHGLFNFNSNNMALNFKPHLATYRRLLTGKWD